MSTTLHPDAMPSLVNTLRSLWRSRGMRVLLLLPAFGLLLVALLWWAVLHKLASEERLILDAAMRDSESIAATFEQRTLRAISDADRTTLLIKYLFERDGGVDLARVIEKGLIPIDAYLLTSVLDRKGRVISSSEGRAVGRDMADRDYFKRHASGDSGNLDISQPTVLRVSGKVAIQLTRRLNAADGTFAGIVLRGGRVFLDRKPGLLRWMNCSIVTAAMPIKRSSNHEAYTKEPLR